MKRSLLRGDRGRNPDSTSRHAAKRTIGRFANCAPAVASTVSSARLPCRSSKKMTRGASHRPDQELANVREQESLSQLRRSSIGGMSGNRRWSSGISLASSGALP
jgi:hypothetical protein